MAEPAPALSLEARLAAAEQAKAAVALTVASELERHCEEVERGEDEADDPWCFAGDNESVDSFVGGCPPSATRKAWIAAQHDERKRLVDEFYDGYEGAEGAAGRESMAEISAAWEEMEKKSLETLTALLKEYKYGTGKWMIFVPASDVDLVWAEVVRALWEGKLGATCKVSGTGPNNTGSHVICVYVDPFWDVAEVERVLGALRLECGINDSIKYKADGAASPELAASSPTSPDLPPTSSTYRAPRPGMDLPARSAAGVTMMNIAKDNEHGIPPSFYSARRSSSAIEVCARGASPPPPPPACSAAARALAADPDAVREQGQGQGRGPRQGQPRRRHHP